MLFAAQRIVNNIMTKMLQLQQNRFLFLNAHKMEKIHKKRCTETVHMKTVRFTTGKQCTIFHAHKF